MAPEVMPATIWRLKKMYMISGGIVMSRMSVKSRFHDVWYWLWKLYSVSCTVAFFVAREEVERIREVVEHGDRLHHDRRHDHAAQQGEPDLEEQTDRAGAVDRAASSSSRGMVETKARNSRMQNDMP